MSQLVKGTFEAKLQLQSFENADAEAKLDRMSIDKTITGDLVATTVGRMLTAGTETKGSAAYVAVERVTGALHGKKGSFALYHTGVMNRGSPALSVLVVPDSGTGELAGLEGEFKIIIESGKHRYEFSYRVSAAP